MAYNPKTHVTTGLPLKLALLRAGLFQHQAAHSMGMNPSTFNMKLLGRRPWSYEEKLQLSRILNAPLEELFPSTHRT